MRTVTDGSYRTEKKDLTPEEFLRAKTACEFVIELTKAISRSGYYDAGHPVSLDVKKGLYDAFKYALGNSSEIMLSCHDAEDSVDIHISGILDEPFNIKKLTHENTLGLFVPKLKDYFERKNLNSFVIKKQITARHFESFIDVMSEPVADLNESASLGEYLTKALIDLDITEVTAIFKDDIVLPRGKLPWRVSIILRRLAKDLKVIPMFKEASADRIKMARKQIVEDIIRPLHNHELLHELIVNCDVISSQLGQAEDSDELERMIIGSMPVNMLFPVSQDVFEVYKESKEKIQSDKDNPAYQQRCVYLAKVLNVAAKKITAEELPDTADFFEQLYENEIIEFDMLPEDIRFDIQTKKLAGDVVSQIDKYIEKALKTSSSAEMESLLVIFHRVIPELVRLGEWPAINQILKAISNYLSLKDFSSSAMKLFPDLPDSVFEGSEEIFAHKYIHAEPEVRNQINDILMQLTSVCIETVNIVFEKCKDPNVLKSVVELLSKKGEPARQWAIKILDDRTQSISMLNVALLVITNVGQADDTAFVKRYVKNSNASIRTRALSVMVKLNKNDAGNIVIEALKDEEEKVRTHAASLIEHELSLSEESSHKLLFFIKAMLQKKNMTINEAVFIAGLLKAIGRSGNGMNKESVENEMIAIAADLLKGRTGILKFIKAELDKEQLEIISACLSTLGKTGGTKSRDYLKTLLHGDAALSKIVHQATEEINRRLVSKN